MIKTKKRLALTILLTMTIVVTLCFCCAINIATAKADTVNQDDEVEPRGLMTRITVDIGADNNQVWANAHNDFTLGLSTVQVYVYLYSSLEYEEDYKNMNLENMAYINDLNMGKSLKVTASINGTERYWRARVEYKLDNKSWSHTETRTYLVDVNGNAIK